MFGLTLAAAAAASLQIVLGDSQARSTAVPDLDRLLEAQQQPIDGKRVALVIGNSSYAPGSNWRRLPNAKNDAKRIADLLGDPARGKARFEVTRVIDGTYDQISTAIRAFADQAATADVAVVYFAGHGFEHKGVNYIVSSDAVDKVDEARLSFKFIDMQSVVAAAQSRGITIFFLDACRDAGPLVDSRDPTRSGSRAAQFGAINAPSSIVIYATDRTASAYDAIPETAPLSPFATAIEFGLQKPGMDLTTLFGIARAYVEQASRTKPVPQIPQLAGSWAQPFYFIPPVSAAAAPAGPPVSAAAPPAAAGVAAGASELTRGAAPAAGSGLGLSLRTLATVDEPILVSRVLQERSAQDIKAMAEAGDPVAAWFTGYMLYQGVGFRQDIRGSRAWLEKAAASGHPGGQLELAFYLMRHGDRGADRARAKQLLEAAAAQDYPKAQTHLAGYLLNGDFGGSQPDEAMRLFRSAAAGGHANALYHLALRGEQASSIAALGALAEEGNREGDQWLCELSRSFAVPKAGEHCLAAAKAGYSDARGWTALRYAAGDGLPRSPDDARYWARLALPSADLSPQLKAKIAPLAE